MKTFLEEFKKLPKMKMAVMLLIDGEYRSEYDTF